MTHRVLHVSLLVLICTSTTMAGPQATSIDRLLRLGPLPLPLPAFHDAEVHGITLAKLAEQPTLDVALLRPREGQRVPTATGEDSWRETSLPASFDHDGPAEVWLAGYLRCDRWLAATLTLSIPDEVQLQGWLDGAAIELTASDDGGQTAELELTLGVHRLVLRSVAPAGGDDWTLAGSLTWAEDLPADALTVSTNSRRLTDIHLVLDAPRAQEAIVSPDGALAAIRLQERPAGGKSEPWIEIRDVASGELVTTWRGSRASKLAWSPAGRQLSFVLQDEDHSDLMLLDLETGQATRLLRRVADLGRYAWAPGGEFVVFERRIEAEKDERKVKRVLDPADRQPRNRDRRELVQAAVPSGVLRQLTAGPLSPSNWSLSPDGKRLLFFLSAQDLEEGRPYFSSELWELDLATLAAERLLQDRWIGGAAYGPEPGTLLLRGSPSAFDGLGRNLPAGMQANDYGGQLYLFDRKSGEAIFLSGDLRPDVARAWWSLDDGLVYALCTDTQFRNVYRADPDRPVWERVDTGVEYTDQFDLARTGQTAVARGSGATTPNQVHAVDLKRTEARLLLDPGADAWQDVAFGEVSYWQAPLPDGEQLDGRIYWPVDHDPQRQYPVIVYYYGGTSPVTVDFGGRYPKNVWAGQDYIVYVPQPSGATGYGQEFAARHVNDCGRRTAWEVIEATKAFLAAHPSADAEHVGCIGASYGGFLTMYLTTQTDLFAAAVSHAGISSIASYWGEGLWGYAYGARALADAFPWSDRKLYIEQSALFHADKITTPLLLVHGDSDTNVPVGESDQLFIALKLLGREVEYVQIQGQDHWILDHEQRIVWNDTILAFFARHLKGRDAWWNALYPED